MLAHAWIVTALSPKSITFFAALLPQFLETRLDFLSQWRCSRQCSSFSPSPTFGYALVASRARRLVRNPRAIGLFNKAGGILLIGAGLATVSVRASSTYIPSRVNASAKGR